METRGSEADTAFLLPAGLAVRGGRVYVLDRMGNRVAAFRTSDGRTLWSVGRDGGGPGELRRPVALAAMPGGVVVADPENSRLAVLDTAGERVREVPFPASYNTGSVCPLADGSFLLANVNAGRPLVRLAPDGKLVAEYDLPWGDLAAAPSVRRQALLAATSRGDGCVVALALGRGFSVFSGRGFSAPRPYVEAFDLPRVNVTRTGLDVREQLAELRVAAQGVDASEGTLVVSFAGETADRWRLVDFYDERTGAYLYTLRSPRVIDRLVRADGLHFVLTSDGGYPALVAFSVDTLAGQH